MLNLKEEENEKKEEEIKFAKLSDVSKIRYNLGNIIFFQNKTLLSIKIFSLIILAQLFILPFDIRYSGFNRILMMSYIGSLIIIVAFILFIVEFIKLGKLNKSLDEFLNKKSKK